VNHVAEPFQPGPLPEGFFLISCPGGKEIIVLKGFIPAFLSIPEVRLSKNSRLNIRELNGKPLKPLSWYHLVLEWTASNESRFVLVMDLKGYKPQFPFFRRLGSLHTTTKRTIRRFTMSGSEFSWKSIPKHAIYTTFGWVEVQGESHEADSRRH